MDKIETRIWRGMKINRARRNWRRRRNLYTLTIYKRLRARGVRFGF